MNAFVSIARRVIGVERGRSCAQKQSEGRELCRLTIAHKYLQEYQSAIHSCNGCHHYDSLKFRDLNSSAKVISSEKCAQRAVLGREATGFGTDNQLGLQASQGEQVLSVWDSMLVPRMKPCR
jgi:hypothetical protein